MKNYTLLLNSFCFIIIIGIFVACKPQPKILSIPQLKPIMWDMITADEWIKVRASNDSSVIHHHQNISLYNKIFALHNTSKADYYSSLHFYESNPKLYKILLDSVVSYGIRTKENIINKLGKNKQ